MTISTLFFLSSFFYCTAVAVQCVVVFHSRALNQHVAWWLGGLGVLAHGALLWALSCATPHWLSGAANLLSLSAWCITVVLTGLAVDTRLRVLIVVSYPMAVVTMVILYAFPSQSADLVSLSPAMLLHIMLSMVTFCVLSIAALIALLLFVQDRVLRRKTVLRVEGRLPPVETLARSVFWCHVAGFVMLSCVLVTSLYTYHSLLFHTPILWQKAILAWLAWCLLLTLLVGHKCLGFGVRYLTYGTLFGLCLLCIIYALSRWLMWGGA